jgi:protein SCO1/2
MIRTQSSPAVPARYFPNVVLRTHDNQRVRFYDDLIRDKIVLINFFYTTCAAACELATANLVKVASSLGDEVGKAVVMLSITIDPATDTPAVLKQYALRHRARTGWYFVTGARKDIDVLRARLGLRDRDDRAITHTGLLAYGKVASGQWAATPVMGDPHAIARSVMRLVNLSNAS